MSLGVLCWAAAAFIFFFLAFDFVKEDVEAVLFLIAHGLVPLGLCLAGVPIAIWRRAA